MSFEKSIDKALNESIIDPTMDRLDPDIFNNNEKLRDDVLSQLMDIVRDIDDRIVPVRDAMIKGSILSYQWLPTSDIDLLIEIDEDINDELYENMIDTVMEKYDGVPVGDTGHPLQVYLLRGEYNKDNADGIYNLYTGWVKGPYNIEVDVDQYQEQFDSTVGSLDLSTGKLRRNLVDYDMLSSLPEDQVKNLKARIRKTTNEINDIVTGLVDQRQMVKDARHAAFDREMEPEEIVKYGSKNELPANVIQKLLERYHYMSFLDELEELLKDDGRVTKDEIDDVRDIFGELGVDNN